MRVSTISSSSPVKRERGLIVALDGVVVSSVPSRLGVFQQRRVTVETRDQYFEEADFAEHVAEHAVVPQDPQQSVEAQDAAKDNQYCKNEAKRRCAPKVKRHIFDDETLPVFDLTCTRSIVVVAAKD